MGSEIIAWSLVSALLAVAGTSIIAMVVSHSNRRPEANGNVKDMHEDILVMREALTNHIVHQTDIMGKQLTELKLMRQLLEFQVERAGGRSQGASL